MSDVRRISWRLGVSLLLLLGMASGERSAVARTLPTSLPAPVACPSCWIPPLYLTWQIQLSGNLDTTPNALMYEIDMFDSTTAQVQKLHDLYRFAICYVDAGSWENWRPDAKSYPKSVLGKPLQGWPGERWVNIRRLDVLGPILTKRVQKCRSKGFDGIDFDNVDGYQNPTGFHLSSADQLRFNTYLANLAHRNGLTVLLKNDPDQVKTLQPYYNGAVVEQCFQYQECTKFEPFVTADKPVFEIEYSLAKSKFCPKAAKLNFNSMKKHLALGPWLSRC
jgi:hypothetical protein